MNNDMKRGAKWKKYFATASLLVIGGGYFLDTKTQIALTSDSSSQNAISVAEAEKIVLQSKTVTQTISSTNASEIPNAKVPDESITVKNQTSKEMPAEDIYTESAEEVVLVANPDMLASGEFADQINLANEGNDCSESCANDSDVNLPAEGEFADQINADAILQQAMLKNPELQPEVKLTEVSPDSYPSTEFGVYTPPPQ